MVKFITTAEHKVESYKQLLDVLEQNFRDCDESVGITVLWIKDKQALEILGRSLKKVSDYYSVGILWKNNEVALKDNRSLAERMLALMKRSI